MAELVLPDPMVPVIIKFWYNPDSGIKTFKPFSIFCPINKFKLFKFCIFSFSKWVGFWSLKKILLNILRILKLKKFARIKLEKIYVIIKVILIKFHNSGFFVQISNG